MSVLLSWMTALRDTSGIILRKYCCEVVGFLPLCTLEPWLWEQAGIRVAFSLFVGMGLLVLIY